LEAVAPSAWHTVQVRMSCGNSIPVTVDPVHVPPAQSSSVVHGTEASGPPAHACTFPGEHLGGAGRVGRADRAVHDARQILAAWMWWIMFWNSIEFPLLTSIAWSV
jgi:hypothetical protein